MVVLSYSFYGVLGVYTLAGVFLVWTQLEKKEREEEKERRKKEKKKGRRKKGKKIIVLVPILSRAVAA